jgi:hypothetical protein
MTWPDPAEAGGDSTIDVTLTTPKRLPFGFVAALLSLAVHGVFLAPLFLGSSGSGFGSNVSWRVGHHRLHPIG